MGVCCNFYRLTSDQITEMTKRAERIIHTESMPHICDAFDPYLYLIDTGVIDEDDDEPDGDLRCCIFKAWYRLHEIFTEERKQDTFPANFIYGGTPFIERQHYEKLLVGFWGGDNEITLLRLGRWFNPEETIQIRDYLMAFDLARLHVGNLEAMSCEWWPSQAAHLSEAISKMRTFFQEAVEHGNCVVTLAD